MYILQRLQMSVTAGLGVPGSGQVTKGNTLKRYNMIYAVKMNGDRVELYDAQTGFYERCVCSDAISATVQGNVVTVNKKNGRTEIYNADTGFYQRSL